MTTLAYVFAGILFSNGIPHFTNGISGRRFPREFPFRTIKDRPMWFEPWFSAPITNVIWGLLNWGGGYLLLTRAGNFSMTQPADITSITLGFIICSIFLAWNFGRVNSTEHIERCNDGTRCQ